MKISIRDLNFFYGKSQAILQLSLNVPDSIVMCLHRPVGLR